MDKHKKADKRRVKAEKYKKFQGNQKEGQGFADKRKKKIQYEYLKMLKKEKKKEGKGKKTTSTELYSDEEKIEHFKKDKTDSGETSNTYSKSEKQFLKKKTEKEKKKKEVLQRKKAIDSALVNYKNQKSKQYQLMCKKTYKGQPVMKNQIEILLHKIQSNKDKT